MSPIQGISIQADPAPGTIESQIADIVDLGPYVRVELEDADGRAITTRLRHDAGVWRDLTPGDIVFVRPADTAPR